MSSIIHDHMKLFLREFFPILIDALKVPHKVISGYVDDCILNLIKNSTFKTGISLLILEFRENKAKIVRERCIEYINEILLHWEIADKEADIMIETIKFGLQDASVRVREIARLAYLNLYNIYPSKTERIKSNLPANLRDRLSNAELSMKAESKEDGTTDESIELSEGLPMTPSLPNGKGLRSKRQSFEENAVTSIQAIIRGNLARRQSTALQVLLTEKQQLEQNEQVQPQPQRQQHEQLPIEVISPSKYRQSEISTLSPGTTERYSFGSINPIRQSM